MTVQSPAVEVLPPAPDLPASAPSDAAVPWPAPAVAWRTLWVLSLVLGLSQLDRGILSLLLQPIKEDLKFSDQQMGLLGGVAFSCVYLILSYPLSMISDRKSRRVMIAIGVAFWSLATAACGLARSFWPMFWARAGVGAGEAVNGPATYSLLADNFPREKLPRAMAILNLGFIGGAAISMIIGAVVIAALAKVHVVLPLLGAVHTWQLVFFVVGLPGLLVAALMFTIPEPKRRGLRADAPKKAPVVDVVEFLVSNARFYGCMFASVFISGVVIYGSQYFRVAFFQRTYHWGPGQAGLIIGVVSLVVSPIGLWAGTWLCERWNRNHDDGNMRVALFANAVSIPFLIAAPLMPDPWLSVACSAVAAALALMAAPPLVAAMQSITPANVRAQVNSLYLLLFSGITGMFGPVWIGQLTDLQHDQTKLRYVLAITTAIGLPIATLLMAGALKPFGRMIVLLKAAEAAGHS